MIKNMTKDEIDVISYDDLAFMLLTEGKKKQKITDLFKQICDLKGLSSSMYENKIGDFFELLTTDKRFYMLDDGTWDLKSKHTNKIKMTSDDDDEDEESTIINDNMDDEIIEDEENIFYDRDETDDEAEDDLKDLVIIDEEDEANSL